MESNCAWIVRDEELYTYDAAINKYEEEKYHTWLVSQRELDKIKVEQNEKRKYFCNQKLFGCVMLLIGIIGSLLLTVISWDIRWLIVGLIPVMIGIKLIVTDKMYIVNDYWWKHGGDKQYNLED